MGLRSNCAQFGSNYGSVGLYIQIHVGCICCSTSEGGQQKTSNDSQFLEKIVEDYDRYLKRPGV